MVALEWPFGAESSDPGPGPGPGPDPSGGGVVGAITDLSTVGNPYINASGTAQFSDVIIWPFGTGQNVGGNQGFSADVDALLTGVNAQFGFNNQPHRFTLTWAYNCFTDNPVAPDVVGDIVDFIIGTFRIRGRVTHVDLQKSSKGLFLSTTIEDVRKDLNKVVLDTYGIFDENEDPSLIANNIIDVHHCELTQGINRDPKALRLLREHGATWIQIKQAIENAGGNIFTALPDDKFIFDRLGQDKADAYRWSFRTTPLLNVLIKIFTDIAYDVYWSMDEQRLKMIDRQQRIDVGVDKIPGVVIGDNVSQLKTGTDEGDRPTSVQIIGGKMEGVIGGGGGTINTNAGVFPASASVGLNIQESYNFRPAWQGASVFYFGADGTVKEDNPTDEELSAALKGIEWWAQKKAQVVTIDEAIASRIDDNIIYPRTGEVFPNLAGHSASGLGLLPNRGNSEDAWVIEWYNRVRNFAQNNYTRTYFLEAGTDLYNELDRFEVIEEAWCGLENEIANSGQFNTGYEIDATYRWLAPFWNENSNKLSAWMFIPGVPLWGLDGKGVAAQYPDWNEDGDRGVYVPIEVRKWNRASSRLTNDASLLPAEKSDRGLIIRLPNICWQSFDIDPQIAQLSIPLYLQGKFNNDSTFDMTIDPLTAGVPFESFASGVNIPVQAFQRYGTQKPSRWSAGSPVVDLSRAEVQQRDEIVPWSYEPEGTNNTVELLDLEGRGIASGRIVDRATVDFLEATTVGLPLITFDQYADGNGIATHGITNLSLSKQANGYWQTRYSAKTHFPQPIQIKPVPEEVLEDFRFALHRVNERFNRPLPRLPFFPPEIFNPKTEDGRDFLEFPKRESFEILVDISNIIEVQFSNGLTDIAYAGVDETGTKWPAAFRANEQGSLNPQSRLAQSINAFAVDGFFQKGMRATYHYEELENGDVSHYFTGGVALSQARIVTVLDSPQIINGVYRMDVQVPQEVFQRAKAGSDPVEFEAVSLEPIEILGARFSDNGNVDTTLSAGDEIMLSGTGNENGNMLKPALNTLNQYSIDVGDAAPANQKDKLIVLSGSRNTGTTTQFATVNERPDLSTGRGGKIQTISSIDGGTLFEDGKIIGASEGNPGTQYFVDFVGAEFNQVAIGSPCIVIQQTEPVPTDPEVAAVTPTKIRLLTYINNPLFTTTDAFGAST